MMLWLLVACLEAVPPEGDACAGCHGGSDTPAPPAALGGGTDPELRGVGAHEAHVFGTALGVPVACTECHEVPASVDAEGHIDDTPLAEVRWSDLGKSGGVAVDPWDAEGLSCSNLYCHGASLTGGQLTAPTWVGTGAAAVSCTACHGLPPPPPHPQSESCSSCHGGGAADPSAHIDGVVTF